MTNRSRRFPPPWDIEETNKSCFIVYDPNEQALAYLYYKNDVGDSSHPTARMNMPTVALQVTIGDYAKWRPIFDKYRSQRAEAGFKNERVYRNVDDPSEVIIWGEASSGAKLRRALVSPELKAAMKEAGGVAGP
jgi:hypothetical protein